MRSLAARLLPAILTLSLLTSASLNSSPLARHLVPAGGEPTLADMLRGARTVSAAAQNDERVYYSNPEAKNRIAITFDDGPHPEYTPRILELLEKYGVRATFFVVGENAARYPELIKRELDSGHEVGNHTYTHADLSVLSYRRVCDEVIFAENVLYEQNEHLTHLLRPPGGLCADPLFKMARRFDYSVILWSIDTRDWAHTPAEQIVSKVLARASHGDVILFHDYIVGESPTLAALEEIIPRLLERGCEFVTVSELFGIE